MFRDQGSGDGLDRRVHRKEACPWWVSTERVTPWASHTGQGVSKAGREPKCGVLAQTCRPSVRGGLRTPRATGDSIREQPLKVYELVSEEMRIHFFR